MGYKKDARTDEKGLGKRILKSRNIVRKGYNTMKIKTIQRNGIHIAEVTANEPLITDTQSALDVMATVKYEAQCSRIIVEKHLVCEDFFILSTGLAGEILQKYVNYGVQLAIVGDYSHYTSKPLHDFIYESNHGKDIFFVSRIEDAVRSLAG